ncbi:MAG: PEP-utilizing enzyme [Gammaproteobacteria bacterium]|nr:PEP-utilizing enzyme [Gammaproteobacteria bacterium]
MTGFTTALDTSNNALERVGGKGRALALLANAGFAVPDGFHVTADAYRQFVGENALQQRILELARPVPKNGAPGFDGAAESIGELFAGCALGDALIGEIRAAYGALPGQPAVAVRSSANAEDLPGLSFAGQQETFLNVRGADAVVRAVKDCWASLWTTQAISYRHQNGIDPDAVAMAVVVQIMVPSEVSGILFTANPATGERGEMVVNASFGLGEAVVGGQVTPDTYVVDRATLAAKETLIGPKEQQIVADGDLGVRLEDVGESARQRSSLSESMLTRLAETALHIEELFDGVPQDIEWAFSDDRLHVLQSRPITNLPVQPIELEWIPRPPAKYLSRRQIVENMPDPICPLFEELYLTEGLESSRGGKSLMVGGGPLFVTLNGYAYQRFDWPQFFTKGANEKPKGIADADLDKAEYDAAMKAEERERQALLAKHKAQQRKQAEHDIELFAETLSDDDRVAFKAWMASQDRDGLAQAVTMPESDNPTFMAFNNTAVNDRQLKEWHDVTRPRLVGIREKWAQVDPALASDARLLEGIREMAIEEGYYWSSNSSHTFGVAKSTDDQFQCFLRESLPDHHFISGQFLSGIESKTMQANADLFEIAQLVRTNTDLATLVIVTPAKFLMDALKARNDSREVLDAIGVYLSTYGHQGYSMDFIEPTQVEDPSALFASLKAMVGDDDYDPKDQDRRAANVREEKFAAISELLDGLPYWQFRFRLWLARRYNHIREAVAFHFGYTWSVLRPMAAELGSRMVAAGTFKRPDDVYFLVTEELNRAIEARARGAALANLGELAAERRELREARKRHHPPGTVPEEASQIKGIAFKETQIKNDESSATMRGFPVSSGRVTAPASVILGPAEFDKMAPGSILVSPLTTPAWTQLFAHAAGLVTDMGSILAHGSIVAREYGIPAVLGVGNGTVRIEHGQTLTIDGDAGTVVIHD